MIEDLLKAKKIIDEYNNLSFDSFIKEYEDYVGHPLDETIINNYRFTGLNNTCFLDFYYEEVFK